MGAALLLWAAPCCHGLRPAVLSSALLSWLHPVAVGFTLLPVGSALLSWAPPCWQSLSVMVGCLSNGRLVSSGSVPQYARNVSVVVDAPPPPSCTVLDSAVLALKLSTQSISNCCFFVGVGPAEPDHLAPCLRALSLSLFFLS